MKVVLLLQAQEDLDAIHEPLFSKIIHRLRVLREFSELGAPMMGPFFGYRSTVVGIFRIIYRVLDRGTIEVAYIRHCKRELKH